MSNVLYERWSNQVEYFLSSLGYAVGIGNIWRFPYMCYRNGGGAFLIPYFLTMVLCGIPLVYLETTLGQFASAGCISIFNINPLFKGAGYSVVILNVIAVTYFCSLMAYGVLYMYHSFSVPLPWEHCDNTWNTAHCTELTGNSSISFVNGTKISTPAEEFFYIKLLRVSRSADVVGEVVWPVFWSNLVCWIIVYLCICNGVKGVGKIVYFTVLFPYVVLSILLVRGMTLPGAWKGVQFYILPDWELLWQPKVWVEAATQVFYSLGPGWGGLVSMASFNHFHYNTLRSSILIPIINGATSIWAGFVVFSVLGFAATSAGMPVSSVATAGPSLAFVTYPTAISMMPAARNFWALLFFVMLFLLGIDTMFVTIEAVIAGVIDEFPKLRASKRIVTLVTCIALFLLSILCNTEGGLHIIGLVDSHVALVVVPSVCLLELVAATHTYGSWRLQGDVEFMTGQPLMKFWIPVWKYVVPGILVIITFYAMKEISSLYGWIIALISVLCIPVYGGYVLYSGEGSLQERISNGCNPSAEWGPSDEDLRLRWLSAHSERGRRPLKRVDNIELMQRP